MQNKCEKIFSRKIVPEMTCNASNSVEKIHSVGTISTAKTSYFTQLGIFTLSVGQNQTIQDG